MSFTELDKELIKTVKNNLGTISVKANNTEIFKYEEVQLSSLNPLKNDDNTLVDVSSEIVFEAKTTKGEKVDVLSLQYDEANFVVLVDKGKNIKLGCDKESLRCLLYEVLHKYIMKKAQ